MKGKTKTYVLLVAVLAIWGVVGFKMLAALSPEPLKLIQEHETVEFVPKNVEAIDTFSIELPDRDPFLGTLYVKKEVKVQPKTVIKKKTFEWVPISYDGLISKQDSKEKICILSIAGQQKILKVGQELDGVKLLRANANEIRVGYKGQTKTIPKI